MTLADSQIRKVRPGAKTMTQADGGGTPLTSPAGSQPPWPGHVSSP